MWIRRSIGDHIAKNANDSQRRQAEIYMRYLTKVEDPSVGCCAAYSPLRIGEGACGRGRLHAADSPWKEWSSMDWTKRATVPCRQTAHHVLPFQLLWQDSDEVKMKTITRRGRSKLLSHQPHTRDANGPDLLLRPPPHTTLARPQYHHIGATTNTNKPTSRSSKTRNHLDNSSTERRRRCLGGRWLSCFARVCHDAFRPSMR